MNLKKRTKLAKQEPDSWSVFLVPFTKNWNQPRSADNRACL